MGSLILRTDVTSVKIHGSHIFAGIGSSVNIFDKRKGRLLQSILCLNGQKIYGILPCKFSPKILVLGGKQFTVLDCSVVDGEQVFIRLFDPVVCDDWLHSGAWFNDQTIALLTAHNIVQKWKLLDRTLISQHCSKDNSILYCGLLMSLTQELLVMAGTVFSEVIIHVYGEDASLHRLRGHKGVIFSIRLCDVQNGRIVTTSDDRSIRIWEANNISKHPFYSIDYWRSVEIVCKHELYGHCARVMRSCFTLDKIVSVGEDSAICFWNHDGSLAKKIQSHQNGSIWSVDADDDILVTGGGDCAVITHPLTLATEYSENKTLDVEIDSPKKLIFTARRNIVILNESNDLVYYNAQEKTKLTYKLRHDSTCKFVCTSSCKQMVAVADMNGKLDVYAENCKDSASLVNIIDTKLTESKILSIHWAGNRHILICLENGELTVLVSSNLNSEVFSNFTLPNCKERWLTAAAVDIVKNIFVVGDRCGNIHVYVKGQKNPVKSFNKVHGRYGPTSITMKNNEVITTGRDGTIKYFIVNDNKVTLMSSKDLEFKWVEKFLDKDENVVCGFQERIFVVSNIKTNCTLLEVPCGGGHRSWDAVRYIDKVDKDYEDFIDMVYIKNSDINIITVQLNKILSKNIINGSHSKEINCLKTYNARCKSAHTLFLITGGEDTTLRISSVDSAFKFEDKAIFKQLSSVRAIAMYPIKDDTFLLISAGGRAQICIKTVSFELNEEITIQSRELVDYMIKGADKSRKVNQNWRNCAIDFDPETRIMDVDCVEVADKYVIVAGCSDATLRIFALDNIDEVPKFLLVNELKFHKTCILKTNCIRFNIENILATCTTRGEVALWSLTDITKENIEPFFVMQTNKSGINSFASRVMSSDRIIIFTGGDDNAIHVVLLEISDQPDLISTKILHAEVLDKCHSSEITGLIVVDNFIISASIDQRITLFEMKFEGDTFECSYLSQTFSDVADIQGMDVVKRTSNSITVCVFGKGLEVIELPTDI